MKTETNFQLTRLFSILFAALFVAFLYTFFHEAGHAITGVLFGGRLSGFNINFFNLSAHVNLSGEFTAVQESIKSISGALLPLVIWIIFILSAPKKTNLMVEFVKIISSSVVASSLLPWVVIPILFKSGAAPAGDDVTAFLTYSKWNVYLVPALFLAVIAFVIVVYLKKADLKVIRAGVLSGNSDEMRNKTTIPVMVSIIVLIALTVFMINISAPSVSFLGQGYRPAAVVKLSEKDYTSDPVYSFTLNEDGHFHMLIEVKNINTKYIDIRLIGAGNYDKQLLHGEGFWTNYHKFEVEESLKKGRYRIVLTSKKSPGKVNFYMKK